MGDRYMGAKKQINIYKFYRACCDKRSIVGKLVVSKRSPQGGMTLKTAHAVYLDGYTYGMFNNKGEKLFQRYRMKDGIDRCVFYPDDVRLPIVGLENIKEYTF